MLMDIVDIRRQRLREWFRERTMPPEEKSYLSQLMSGKASFGERAARRIETSLGMGEKYLDRLPEQDQTDVESFISGPGKDFVNANEILELIELFKQCSLRGRKFILESARVADKGTVARRATGSSND